MRALQIDSTLCNTTEGGGGYKTFSQGSTGGHAGWSSRKLASPHHILTKWIKVKWLWWQLLVLWRQLHLRRDTDSCRHLDLDLLAGQAGRRAGTCMTVTQYS